MCQLVRDEVIQGGWILFNLQDNPATSMFRKGPHVPADDCFAHFRNDRLLLEVASRFEKNERYPERQAIPQLRADPLIRALGGIRGRLELRLERRVIVNVKVVRSSYLPSKAGRRC